MYRIALLMLLFTAPLLAFDVPRVAPGTVLRPGLESQSVRFAVDFTDGTAARIYRINDQTGTPRAMAVDFHSASGIQNPNRLAAEFIDYYNSIFGNIKSS